MNSRVGLPNIAWRAGDRVSAWRVAADAVQKARAHHAAVRSVFQDIVCLGRLVSAWAAGKYTRVPWRTIAMATGALVYFVNPLDLIPDAILVVGYLDDVAVISMVVSAIRRDIERFQRWEASRGERVPEAQLV